MCGLAFSEGRFAGCHQLEVFRLLGGWSDSDVAESAWRRVRTIDLVSAQPGAVVSLLLRSQPGCTGPDLSLALQRMLCGHLSAPAASASGCGRPTAAPLLRTQDRTLNISMSFVRGWSASKVCRYELATDCEDFESGRPAPRESRAIEEEAQVRTAATIL